MRRKGLVLLAVLALLLTMLCTVAVSAEEAEYTLGEELLKNGDFEQGALYWGAENNEIGTAWVTEGAGRDGSFGLKLFDVTPDEDDALEQRYNSKVEAVPCNRYLLSFDYLANPDNKFYVHFSASGISRITIKTGADGDGTWKTYTKMITLPSSYVAKDSGFLRFSAQTINEEAPTVVDNVSLRECKLNAEPQSLQLDYNETTLLLGRTQTLKVLTNPVKSNLNNVVWESSDPSVATVTYGKVEALSGGTTVITVTAENGKTDSCKVTVVNKEATEADLTVDSLTWTGGRGEVDPATELKFTATVTNVGGVDVTEPFFVDFSAGQERIARVEYSGGVKVGESVTVTTEAWAAVAGDHMMAVRVNPTLSVAENDYTKNNTYQINLRVAEDRLAPTYNADLVTEAGFTNLTFSEDFDSLDTVDKAASGREGYKWYVTRPYGASTLTPDDYSVKDGVMTLHSEVSTYNYGLSTVDIPTWNGYTFHKGYLEYRIRMPHYDSALSGGPAVWSMPEDKLHNVDGLEMWIEVDWMEYWGITKDRPGGYYTICLHEQWVDENVTVTDWYENTNIGKTGFGDAEWHTMGFLWEENHLRAFFDGKQVLDQTYGEDEVPIPLTVTQQGEFKIDGVLSYMNEQILPIFINGSKGNPMEIDYLRIWQVTDTVEEDVPPAAEDDVPPAEDVPQTGAASALPALCTALTLSAAGVYFSFKRK